MEISAAPLIYGLIFFGVLMLVEGIYLTVFGKSISLNNKVNRRLHMLEKGGSREQVLEQLRKEMTQHMKARNIPLYSILSAKAQRANIAFSPKALVGIMGLLSFISFLLGIGFKTKHKNCQEEQNSKEARMTGRSQGMNQNFHNHFKDIKIW